MQKAKLPSLITILILTLVTSLTWVGFSIFRAFTTTPTPSVSEEILSPITPTLDTSTIQKVESALFFNEAQIPELSPTLQTAIPIPTIVPTIAPTPESSPSATPEVSPIPSPTP